MDVTNHFRVFPSLKVFGRANADNKVFHRMFYVFAPIMGALAGNRGGSLRLHHLHKSIQGFVSVDEASSLLTEEQFGNLRWRSFFGGVGHVVAAENDSK